MKQWLGPNIFYLLVGIKLKANLFFKTDTASCRQNGVPLLSATERTLLGQLS